MSLLPDGATFHERVQDCFVAYRSRGVALSAQDVELVEAWATTGAPFEVVARGIRRAAEAALFDAVEGEVALRSLRACRRQVDQEIAKYLKGSVGRTEVDSAPSDEPFFRTRHKKLLSGLKKVAKEQVDLSQPLLRLVSRLTPPQDFEAASRQEDLALAVLARALPRDERRACLREARSLVQKAGAMTARVRVQSLRFHRAALVRQRLSIPAFW